MTSKRYFRLNHHTVLVQGDFNNCLYDFVTGQMLELTDHEYSLLAECEKNRKLGEMCHVDTHYLNTLEKLNLGKYYKRPVYIEKAKPGKSGPLERILPSNCSIESLFIELHNNCNLDCKFCVRNDNTLYRKTGCKRWPSTGEKLTVENWKIVIRQARQLNCRNIVFVGGEPFLEWGMLRELILYVAHIGPEIKLLIYTNGTLLNGQIAKFLKEYRVELNIQLLSDDETVFNQITRTGIYSDFERTTEILDAENVTYFMTLLANKYNQDEVEAMLKRYRERGKKIRLEFIYPRPENVYYPDKFIQQMYDKKSNLMRVSTINFYNMKRMHNCYGSGLAVSASGDVFPCIMSRTIKLGNVRNEEIVSILKGSQYERLACLSKDRISRCKKCSFRYGCHDCRALEAAATGDLAGMEYCEFCWNVDNL